MTEVRVQARNTAGDRPPGPTLPSRAVRQPLAPWRDALRNCVTKPAERSVGSTEKAPSGSVDCHRSSAGEGDEPSVLQLVGPSGREVDVDLREVLLWSRAPHLARGQGLTHGDQPSTPVAVTAPVLPRAAGRVCPAAAPGLLRRRRGKQQCGAPPHSPLSWNKPGGPASSQPKGSFTRRSHHARSPGAAELLQVHSPPRPAPPRPP